MVDVRHSRRMNIVQNLFSWGFHHSTANVPHPEEKKQTEAIVASLEEIDKKIQASASRFSLETIAKTDLAILRLSIYELLIEKKHPYKVVIDEAVELAKEFGAEKSSSFVNGVLGKIVEEYKNIL